LQVHHNGTGAYELQIQPDKLVHVDASETSLRGRYPARARIESELGSFLAGIIRRLTQRTGGWTDDDLAAWRTRLRAEQDSMLAVAPAILTDPSVTCAAFFDAFQAALPADAIVVTDSGCIRG
jgi:thiamine pyrophosphate-dependent acetolactate synthase large subunit-like protein